MNPLKRNQRLALLLHEGLESTRGKTGLSILRYGINPIAAVIDRQNSGKSLSEITRISREVPIVDSVADSMKTFPDVLVIGIATSGGLVPDDIWLEIRQALDSGLSVVNGLHYQMGKDPSLTNLLKENCWIWDVRFDKPNTFPNFNGKSHKLDCLRVLTVGTDISIGKMTTSLEMHHKCLEKNLSSQFIATGQTGMMLGYKGIPLDNLTMDQAVGAVEDLVLKNNSNCEILNVEGQGSLLHPGSTATMVLLRGVQPTNLILVHRAKQKHILKVPSVKIPPLREVVNLYETVASSGGYLSHVPVSAVSLNTYGLTDTEALEEIDKIQDELNLPCTDIIRYKQDNKMFNSIFN